MNKNQINASKMDTTSVVTPLLVTNSIQVGDKVSRGIYSANTTSPTSDMLVDKSALDVFKKEILAGTLGGGDGIGSTNQALISPPLTDPYFLERSVWDFSGWELIGNEAVFKGTASSVNYLRFKNTVFRSTGKHALFIYVSHLSTGALHLTDSDDKQVAVISSPGIHTIEVDVTDLALDSFYIQAKGVYPEDRIVLGAYAICYLYRRFTEYLDTKVVEIVKNSKDIAAIIPPAPFATARSAGIITPGATMMLSGDFATMDVNVDNMPSAGKDNKRGVVSVGPGIDVNDAGELSVTLASLGVEMPERATDLKMGLVRIANPIEPANPLASPGGYGGAGEYLGTVYDNIDVSNRTGNFLVTADAEGTLPFSDVSFIIQMYSSTDRSVKYQIGINPYTGETLERTYTNLTWSEWGTYGENGITNHNHDANAHPELRAILIETIINEANKAAAEAVTEHNSADDAHANLLAMIDAIPQQIRDLVGTHNLDITSHPEIREFVRTHVAEEIGKLEDQSVDAHNVSPDAHEDIRMDIDDSIVEHNSDEGSHPDIRKMIADEVAILNDKMDLMKVEFTEALDTMRQELEESGALNKDPEDYGEAAIIGTLPEEWPEDHVGHQGIILVADGSPELELDDNNIANDNIDSSCVVQDELPVSWPEDLEPDGLLVVSEEPNKP